MDSRCQRAKLYRGKRGVVPGSATGPVPASTQLFLTPPRSYHFVAAAGEAAEAPDGHLEAATGGHGVGACRQPLKE